MTHRLGVVACAALTLALCSCDAPDSRHADRGLWDQTRAQVALQLADEHIKGGRFDRARALLVAHAASDDVRLQLALVRIDLEEGRYAAALDRLDTVPVEGRDMVQYCDARAVACEGLGRWEEAAQTYERAYRLEPGAARLIAWLDTLVLADRSADALRTLNAERARFPGEPAVQAAAARLYAYVGDAAAAGNELETSLLDEPQSFTQRRRLAGAYMAAGRYSAALPIWRELVAAAPDADQRRDCRAQLAACLLSVGQPEEAIRLCRVMTLTQPDDVAAYVALATAALAAGQPAGAAEAAQHALHLNPDNADARLALACAYADQAQFPQACRVLSAARPDAADDGLVRELLQRWENQLPPPTK